MVSLQQPEYDHVSMRISAALPAREVQLPNDLYLAELRHTARIAGDGSGDSLSGSHCLAGAQRS